MTMPEEPELQDRRLSAIIVRSLAECVARLSDVAHGRPCARHRVDHPHHRSV
jgi:hypothetical protein